MTELLAPAGNLKTLKAAIASGADAVYLGLSAFNARIKADNFTEENLTETVTYCHVFGVKVYVTVNVSVKNDEITAVERLIKSCSDANVDAFIISDLAVVDVIQRIAPHIAMHASTQMGICNLEGAKFVEKLGFTRVVLARETTLEEIRAIKLNTSLEIEYFVHGALCVAFSGKCLMSSVINGGSGNRGRCLQPCRLHYNEESSGNDGYLLSTSDLCMIDKLQDLEDAGVSSYKIEGRLRRPEYVYKTVKTYRKVIDNKNVFDKSDIITLKYAYNRGGFTHGYAYDETRDIMSVNVQSNLGYPAGKIISVKDGFLKLDKSYDFCIGDGYKLFDKNGAEKGGGKIYKIISGKPYVNGANAGDSINVTSRDFTFNEKKIIVNTSYILNNYGILSLTYSADEISVTVHDDKFDLAESKPLDEKILSDALTKFGDGIFEKGSCVGTVEGSFFAPRSTLNALRRRGLALLTEKLANKVKMPIIIQHFDASIIKNDLNQNGLIATELQEEDQLSAELIDSTDFLIYYPDVFSIENAKRFLTKASGAKVFLKLTPNARENDVKLFNSLLDLGFYGVFADNYYALTLAKKHNIKVFAGQGLNIFNNKTLDIINPDLYLASPELNAVELKQFNSPFVYAYGKLPLMNFSHCVAKLNLGGDCTKCKWKKEVTYIDDKNYCFDIMRNKAHHCYFTLYNSKTTDISAKFTNCGFNYYLNMLQCDSNKAVEIVKAFRQNIPLNTPNHTYGHLKRGIE